MGVIAETLAVLRPLLLIVEVSRTEFKRIRFLMRSLPTDVSLLVRDELGDNFLLWGEFTFDDFSLLTSFTTTGYGWFTLFWFTFEVIVILVVVLLCMRMGLTILLGRSGVRSTLDTPLGSSADLKVSHISRVELRVYLVVDIISRGELG